MSQVHIDIHVSVDQASIRMPTASTEWPDGARPVIVPQGDGSFLIKPKNPSWWVRRDRLTSGWNLLYANTMVATFTEKNEALCREVANFKNEQEEEE